VNYQEKFYAAGQDPGRLLQARSGALREGDADLRLIDRPIRPLFVKGFKNEVQVVAPS
jgi:polyribonucleotide nucleotidyltransferase